MLRRIDSRPTVLIVEDDRGIADMLSQFAQDWQGWRAVVALTCGQAKSLLRGVSFDLVFLDYLLDSGLCANQLMDEVPELAGTPVVLMTAASRAEELTAGLRERHGDMELLKKPFDLDRLERIMGENYERAQGRPHLQGREDRPSQGDHTA